MAVHVNQKKITKSNYHLSIGHFASRKVVFNFIKHPHCLHLTRRLLKYGHSLQIFRRYSMRSLSLLGCEGSNKSLNFTSSLIPTHLLIICHRILTCKYFCIRYYILTISLDGIDPYFVSNIL
jgi:hypothetical protein